MGSGLHFHKALNSGRRDCFAPGLDLSSCWGWGGGELASSEGEPALREAAPGNWATPPIRAIPDDFSFFFASLILCFPN